MDGKRSYFPPEVPPSRLRPRTQIVLIIVTRFTIISLILIAIVVLIRLFTGWSMILIGIALTIALFVIGFLAVRVFIKAFQRSVEEETKQP